MFSIFKQGFELPSKVHFFDAAGSEEAAFLAELIILSLASTP